MWFSPKIWRNRKRRAPDMKSNRLQMSDQLNLWNPKFSEASFALLDQNGIRDFAAPILAFITLLPEKLFWNGRAAASK